MSLATEHMYFALEVDMLLDLHGLNAFELVTDRSS